MPIQHAVLALLADGANHGYELKAEFETSIGPQWGQLNIGHLYQVLDRLSRDGLVSSQRVAQQVKPDRVVYELTDAGRAELAGWLEAPSPRTGGFRDDFFLKLMAAARTGDPGVVSAVIARQRTFLLHELRNLEQLRAGRPPFVALLISAAARHVSADLDFLDEAESTVPVAIRRVDHEDSAGFERSNLAESS